MRWFDEEFAGTIKRATETNVPSFETVMEKLEHRDLMASVRRRRRAIAEQ